MLPSSVRNVTRADGQGKLLEVIKGMKEIG